MNWEDILKIGGIVLVALFLFQTLFHVKILGGQAAEAPPITPYDVQNYMFELDKNNKELNEALIELQEELNYWSSIDQAEEIKKLQKRPTRSDFGLTLFFMFLFGAGMAFFLILFFRVNEEKMEFKDRTTNIKLILIDPNSKKDKKLKDIESEIRFLEK